MQKQPTNSPTWQRYISEGVIDKTVSPVIAESWQRCSTHKIDPLHIEKYDSLSGRSLNEKIKIYNQLIQIAAPIINELFSFINDCRGSVLLTDNEGYILYSRCNSEFMEEAKKVRLTVGTNWDEKNKGTNAIGTSLVTQNPIHIHSQEHFCQENHILTCSAAPIFNPQGEIIGTLDISTYYQDASANIMGLVVGAAKTIETKLILENAKLQSLIAYRQISTIMETTNDGLLAIDRDGRITHINQIGSKLLGIPQKQCIGQSFNQLFNEADKWMAELQQGKERLEKSILLPSRTNSPPARYHIKMIADHQDQFWSACISLVKAPVKAPAKTAKIPLPAAHYTYQDIVGSSDKIEDCKKLVLKAAQSTSTVLLQGETGTGKEVLAQAIHNGSHRACQPFIAINMGAIPASLIEGELFGYEEGAFTGARKGGQPGKFELANGGTIFLDEISEMPLTLQIHLLRVLEERQVTRLGGHNPIKLDIRIIAATNRNLQDQIQKGTFRLDLYYRLNVLAIQIPPLRERKSDIPILADHIIKRLGEKMDKPDMTLSPDAIDCLMEYSWPGNIRELDNILERAMNYTDESIIYPQHFPHELQTVEPQKLQTPPLLRNKEMEAILAVLDQTNGNLGKAAKLLGIGRTTLYRKLKKFNNCVTQEG